MVTSGAGPVNAGTVTFTVKNGPTTIGSPVTSGTVASGAAGANFTLPGGTGVGGYTIQAVYNAGSNFITSSDSTHTLTVNPSSANITLDTSPTGLMISGDGGATFFVAPHTFQFAIGSQHVIATMSTQTSAPDQYVFLNWSDAGAISHTITTPSTDTSYTASFKTQYLLTTQASPAAAGTILPASQYVDAGSVVSVSASANSGYVFTGFSGGLSGSTTPQNVTVNAPVTVTANFTGGPTSLGGSLGAKSGPINARTWPITIGNNGPGVALGAALTSLTLQQTLGAACTPVIGTSMPLAYGDLAPHATATHSVTIDFSDCTGTVMFKATATLSANGGAATGTITKLNQLP